MLDWLIGCTLRHRLHGHGFQSKRFHDLDTASKMTRFRRVYTESIQPFMSRRSRSQAFALPQLDLGMSKEYISMSSCHFVFMWWLRLQKNDAIDVLMHFLWADDEVQLLLKVTNEYQVSKTAENVDWESIQKKYSEILDRYKDELEKASGSRKDYPHKGEEITKQCLTNKLKLPHHF